VQERVRGPGQELVQEQELVQVPRLVGSVRVRVQERERERERELVLVLVQGRLPRLVALLDPLARWRHRHRHTLPTLQSIPIP
jgi:hypothetical protein